MDPRTTSTVEAARAVGADWALLTAPDSVAYAAGHYAGVEMGPSPFDGGPTTALVGTDGQLHVVCNELERSIADASRADTVTDYVSLGFSDLRPLEEKYVETLARALDAAGVSGTVAVQEASLPASAAALVRERATTLPIDAELSRRRAVKTEPEVAALQRCADATAVGKDAAWEHTRPGEPELHPWREVRYAMEAHAGARCPVAGDFITGVERTAKVGGWATDRVIQPDDPVIADLAPRIDGYWGDSCTTFVLGRPTDRFVEMYAVAYRAFEKVRERLAPGIVAGDFDDEVRSIITDAGYANPVHLGHGIGTSVHEWPRIVPGQTATLEPGMVLMIEPGCYHPEIGGVRLEQMFRVTDTGHEVMSPFEISPEVPVTV